MNKKVIFIIIVLLISCLPIMINADGEFWLDGWDYRKYHIVLGSSGSGNNYQISIIVYYNSGVDSANLVFLNGKCQNDFDDIRFTDNDGETLLDYYIETLIIGEYALFWIEISDNLDNAILMYIYYGNSEATSLANGDNTFLFFDDFSGTLDKWDILAGTPIIDNGELELTNGEIVESKVAYTTKTKWITKIKYNGTLPASSAHMIAIWRTGDSGVSTVGWMWINSVSYKWRAYYKGTYSQGLGTYKTTLGTYRFVSFVIETELNFTMTGTLSDTAKQTFATSTLDNSEIRYDSGINTCYVDYTFLRKYVVIEPIHSIWSSEETILEEPIYDDSESSLIAILALIIAMFALMLILTEKKK